MNIQRCCLVKRICALVLAVIFVFMLAGCNRQEAARKDIFSLVEENYEVIVKACEEKEVQQAIDAGLQVCTLGRRILRCETAPLCALSAIMYAAGEF